MMRTVQEIFNVVITEGFYTGNPIYNQASWYMCEALHQARVAGHISTEERNMAVEEIEMYLGDYSFLRAALRSSGLPHEYEDRLAIYRNWANRPQLTGTDYDG